MVNGSGYDLHTHKFSFPISFGSYRYKTVTHEILPLCSIAKPLQRVLDFLPVHGSVYVPVRGRYDVRIRYPRSFHHRAYDVIVI